ncbi:MAG: prepilin-type N-terminal cleavage/methylation domain-containing protein [Candidatus Omnitrophica bacterium]|nr:prepilin-type N-terminal cleavage/methylation domain-containing protein [Candidatus Omnitrophota bacterium]
MLGKKGFTLIELMVVIIIVGILAAVAVPMMRANVRRAYGTEGAAIAGSIRTAERIYQAEHKTYTDNLALLSLNAAELNGLYYGVSNVSITATTTTFTANIIGHATGKANGDWVQIDTLGNITDNF